MRLQIITDGVEITPELSRKVDVFIQKPLSRLTKDFAPDLVVADLRLTERTDYECEASFDLWLPGKKQIFAKTENKDLFYAIVDLRHEVERQIKRYLDALNSGQRPGKAISELN